MVPTFPPKEDVLSIFIALETPSAAFELANLAPNGKHDNHQTEFYIIKYYMTMSIFNGIPTSASLHNNEYMA
jgi:hypothetical protein